MYSYIFGRVIDAFLKEDICGLTTESKTVAEKESIYLVHHIATDHTLWIPVLPSRYLQLWVYNREYLVVLKRGDDVCIIDDVTEFVRLLGSQLNEADQQRFSTYAEECLIAIEHGNVMNSERNQFFKTKPHSSLEDVCCPWSDHYLYYDRLGSFQDHPYYPTARAKVGFARDDLKRYAPECAPVFKLKWLAVVSGKYEQLHTYHFSFWPSFEDVGLPATLQKTHVLLPVHPMMWERYLDVVLSEAELAQDCIKAPQSYLDVTPTLSVRTVVVVQSPDIHIKLPLTIRTLSHLNIRTIKPSTLYDGFTTQRVLEHIIKNDSVIGDALLHVDEGYGGCAANSSSLAFIVRRYPAELTHERVVTVASLASISPTGQTVAQDLADHYFDGDLVALITSYIRLMLQIHLRLWQCYGIALEAHQQNSMLVFYKKNGQSVMKLLLKDNDSPGIDRDLLLTSLPECASLLEEIVDPRLLTLDRSELHNIFTTIILQLNIASLIESLFSDAPMLKSTCYRFVCEQIDAMCDGTHTLDDEIRHALLDSDFLPVKYMLTVGSLFDKKLTSARDVNKFYGQSCPNFLKGDVHAQP